MGAAQSLILRQLGVLLVMEVVVFELSVPMVEDIASARNAVVTAQSRPTFGVLVVDATRVEGVVTASAGR